MLTERLGRGRRAARLVVRLELPLIVLWLGLGWGLSAITTRIVDWLVMTDELLYERLAISVAHLHSPLPHVHGELIANANQLYPLLLAPFYAHGYAPDSLHDAHLLNAFVMSSACIPAFLLARRVTGRRWAAYGVAILTVCVPWIVFSGFLLTEVVGYPAFLWAVLAIQRATIAPSLRNDVIALLGLGLAILSRTQFDVLLVVPPLAFYRHELALTPRGRGRSLVALRSMLRGHRLLAWAYAAVVVALASLAAAGRLVSAFGTYGSALQGNLLPGGIGRSLLEHVAVLALGLGILPFVVGTAWLCSSLVRPAAGEAQAFAAVCAATLAAVILEVTSFDVRLVGGIAADRYLFYLAPLVLTSFAAALCLPPWPRRSLLVPLALVVAGFAVAKLPNAGGININSPVSDINGYLRRSGHSLNGARGVLIVATLLLTTLFAQGSVMLQRARLVTILALFTLAVLPAETGYAFARLFSTNGTAGRPLTLQQGGVFDWVDRTVGTQAGVTMVPYAQLPGDYWASVAYWWDVEFWNKSVDRAAYYPGEYVASPSTFPATDLHFDPETGAANASLSRYVLQSARETRFRFSGDVQTFTREALLIDAGSAWRADWLSFGLYDDGWTKPGVVARIRIFAVSGQAEGLERTLALRIETPAGPPARSVVIRSNIDRWSGRISGDDGAVVATVQVCQPPRDHTDVDIHVSGSSRIFGDMRSFDTFGAEYRLGGAFLSVINLAGTGPACHVPR
jgi:hypothetical protein